VRAPPSWFGERLDLDAALFGLLSEQKGAVAA
jgi:hypothetical protein